MIETMFAVIDWSEFVNKEMIQNFVESGIILILGVPFVLIFANVVDYLIRKRFKAVHFALISRKLIIYIGFLFITIFLLLAFDINLSAILGTAGLATLGFGYAGRTSLSNLVSGFFLMGEKPFEVGDMIEFKGTRGFVQSIDLLSIKVRTFNHVCLRIPNDSLMSEEFINVTKYPIRRMDVIIKLDYKESPRRVFKILREVASKNEYALEAPEPVLFFQDYGESYMNILFGVWFEKPYFIPIQNTMLIEIKERFNAEGIEIPVPHLDVVRVKNDTNSYS